ncbi:MAG TPA: helix-turn-helix transcriptional regulator [Chloroflexota bacterium]|nr:helix-turn-helix transcriptional regulator [Chloroflexota bacterium]
MATLREHRRRKLYSIASLAKASGVSTKTIVDLEHGRTVPRLVTIRKLSEQLGVEPSEVEEFHRTIEEDGEGKLAA